MTSDNTFYPERPPEEALDAYLASLDNVYDRARAVITRRFLEKHLRMEALSVLEVGCGGGAWSSHFAARAASLTACDIRPHLVEAAKLNVARSLSAKHAANVHWFAGNITAHTFDTQFDFIFLKDVIEHKVMYLPDLLLHATWPFSRTGWALGVMLERYP